MKMVWKYRIWWFGALLLVGMLSFFLWSNLKAEPIDSDNQPYPAIKLQQTTKQQLIDQVGDPYTEYSTDQFEILSQKTVKSPYKPDLFYLKDGKVVMKEEWYEPTIYFYSQSDFIQKYGNPPKTLYVSPANDVPVTVYIYPNRGLAAYIQEDAKAVWHVQYFKPMSVDNYLKLWGKNLSETKPDHTFTVEPK